MMLQAGLILEGGGLRGVYTAGVLDAFIEADLEFASVYGVSAGSCQACSFLSKQKGRGFHSCADHAGNAEYSGMKSFLKTGDFFNVDYCYRQIPDVFNPYDHETFEKYTGKFYAVVTNLETGEAEYLRVRDMKKEIWKIRASSSLPLISRTIVVGGKKYLDGGVADSIPIHASEAEGNKKNVVILTREEGYQKEANKLMPLIRMRYKKYPAFTDAAEMRHIYYNDTLAYLEEQEKEGNIIIVRPKQKVEVDRLESDYNKLKELYDVGCEDGKAAIEAIRALAE